MIAFDAHTMLVVLLIVVLLMALPVYPYSRSWGYYPSGFLGVILLLVLFALLL